MHQLVLRKHTSRTLLLFVLFVLQAFAEETFSESDVFTTNPNTTQPITMISRAVQRVVTSIPMKEGAGVTIRRTIGGPKIDTGFETVTYMLDGLMEHRDHKGNVGLLGPGAVQWMTAGRGIIHSEMPKQKDGRMHGFQMWVNLPASHKMIPPRYQDIQNDQIPVVKTPEGITIKVMAGDSHGVSGAVNGIVTAPLYMDITLPAGTSMKQPVPDGHTAFCYGIEGTGHYGSTQTQAGPSTLVVFESTGNSIEVKAPDTAPCRFLLAAGKPLNEPIARHGPFVMNTQQEIMQAFRDYQAGTLAQ